MKIPRTLLATLAAAGTASAAELFVGPDPASSPAPTPVATSTSVATATPAATPLTRVAPWLYRAAPWIAPPATPAPTPWRDPCPGCGMG